MLIVGAQRLRQAFLVRAVFGDLGSIVLHEVEDVGGLTVFVELGQLVDFHHLFGQPVCEGTVDIRRSLLCLADALLLGEYSLAPLFSLVLLEGSLDLIWVDVCRVDLALCDRPRAPEHQTEDMARAEPALLVHISQHLPTARPWHLLFVAQDSREDQRTIKHSIRVFREIVNRVLLILLRLDLTKSQ